MKDSPDSTAVGRAVDGEVFANRRLIRPSFNRTEPRAVETRAAEIGEMHVSGVNVPNASPRAERPSLSNGKKSLPPGADPRREFLLSKANAGQNSTWSWCCRMAKRFTASSKVV